MVSIIRDGFGRHLDARVRTPETLDGTGVLLQLYVEDVDGWFDRAVRHGGTPTMRPADAFFVDRYGWPADPFSHLWAPGSVKEVLLRAGGLIVDGVLRPHSWHGQQVDARPDPRLA